MMMRLWASFLGSRTWSGSSATRTKPIFSKARICCSCPDMNSASSLSRPMSVAISMSSSSSARAMPRPRNSGGTTTRTRPMWLPPPPLWGGGAGGAAWGAALLAADSGLAVAAPLLGGLGNHRPHALRLPALVQRHEGDVGRAGVAALAGEDVLRKNLHAHFHRSVEDAVHRRLQHNQLAHLDGVAEVEVIHRHRGGVAVGVAMGGDGGGDVHQVHPVAAPHVPKRVGLAGQHHFNILGLRRPHRLALSASKGLTAAGKSRRRGLG